ncbi:zinc-ribbon domain-containing protein [Desulfococcus sp.]|uniref:zinc-ribbon domain-containing protein n=1 Tax=Desulfococcus sp. TaxID=2025834 RepID=UPI0035936EC7
MKINCVHCQKAIVIPDEKVPLDKAFSLNCPRCSRRFTVDAIKSDPPGDPNSRPAGPDAAGSDDSMDGGAPVNPFQFLEEGAKTAILCMAREDLLAQVRAALAEAGYHTLETTAARDTLRQMRFHDFDLVVLDELFGTRDPEMNHVLKYVSQLTMDSRRWMFVILVSDRFMTGDNMQAYHNSVNLIINPQDIHQFGMIMKRGLGEHEAFYRVFNQEYEKLNGI